MRKRISDFGDGSIKEAILTKNEFYDYLIKKGKIIKFECETIDSDINKKTREEVKDLLWK